MLCIDLLAINNYSVKDLEIITADSFIKTEYWFASLNYLESQDRHGYILLVSFRCSFNIYNQLSLMVAVRVFAIGINIIL